MKYVTKKWKKIFEWCTVTEQGKLFWTTEQDGMVRWLHGNHIYFIFFFRKCTVGQLTPLVRDFLQKKVNWAKS